MTEDLHVFSNDNNNNNGCQDQPLMASCIIPIDELYHHVPLTASGSPPESITPGATTNTTVSVSWPQVSGATGYYVSYQRQDLGTPPVVTPQYERLAGETNNSVTLSGLEPGTTYRIRVWSILETSVSSVAHEKDVTTMESGECFVPACFRV